ncbi:hypothetical protein [Falsarthrobacter nasiphocae]|uniref:Uncharacterized protein n=1 Tax=Falsarthrobacter nasiphocae TaxID=189863 RepID=A0AAE3YEQ2_9MICC|nr:hypothetical protein [Falsarthrobacter nasiphocae]MDR6892488.1 hypothetical protein [Falsarthrobacter nasiphocae]
MTPQLLPSPRAARRTGAGWLAAAAALAVALLATGLLLRTTLPNPISAEWLWPGAGGTVVRTDSPRVLVYPLAALSLVGISGLIHTGMPRLRARLEPFHAQATFVLTLMCANIGVLGWLRPTVFNAWLALVYIAALVALVVSRSHARKTAAGGQATARAADATARTEPRAPVQEDTP